MTIKIYHRQHILLAAEILKRQLEKSGHAAELVTECNSADECLYIIYCAFIPDALPPNYIVYQTEVTGSHWWEAKYYNAIRGAKAIWDYSIENHRSYPHYKNVSIVTPGIDLSEKPVLERKFDVLFYGYLNERRRALLAQLRNGYNIRVVENDYANSLRTILLQTKIVINIHFYEKPPLEVFRVNEALSFGCHVISEPGAGMERYHDTVYFATQPAEFRACIEKAKQREFNYDLKGLDNLEEIRNAMGKI